MFLLNGKNTLHAEKPLSDDLIILWCYDADWKRFGFLTGQLSFIINSWDTILYMYFNNTYIGRSILFMHRVCNMSNYKPQTDEPQKVASLLSPQ